MDRQGKFFYRCNEDGEWHPQNVGECVGDPIEVVTVYHPPVEEENAEVSEDLTIILPVNSCP